LRNDKSWFSCKIQEIVLSTENILKRLAVKSTSFFYFYAVKQLIMDIESLHNIFLACSTVTTDSRNCPDNSMFFALKGESFNGNIYASDAIKSGARYAVVDDKDIDTSSENIILVDDVLKTLQQLALYHREWLSIPIVAITGTNGKTTTKELIREVLNQKYNIEATRGNFNNHIGVPLTLLSFTKDTEIGIVEMGANHPGEIEFLCNITRPDFGLITNIGKAHLEGFGSIEGVMKTKGELYTHLAKSAGTIFVNRDNSILKKILPEETETVLYGTENNDGVVHGQTSNSGFFLKLKWTNTVTGNSYDIDTKLIGNYNLENVLAAITISCYFNVPDENINSAISNYTPSNNRSQYLKTDKNEILLDAYNANPSSMQKALENFKEIGGNKTVLILGEMKELGSDSKQEHIALISIIKNVGANKIYLIGEELKHHLMLIPEAKHFISVDELIKELESRPLSGYKILVKGSRLNKLEECVGYL